MNPVHVTVLVLYLAVMVGIGLWFSRRSQVAGSDDYMFAGRRLPRPVLVGTLLATWVGSGTIIGGANFAYTYGPLASIFFFAGTPVGILVLYLVAGKVREAAKRTVPELLEDRFGTPTRMVAATITMLAYIGIVAYQFTGGGYVLSLITPLSVGQATVVTGLLIAFLAVGGGLLSVAWTDALSALVIVVTLLVSLGYVFVQDVGGLGSYVDQLSAPLTTLTGGLTPVQLLGYFLPLFLLILADQNMYQRLASARDAGTARTSTLGFFLASFLVTVPVALLASASSFLLPGIEPDTAVLSLAAEGYTPAVVGGLILAGAFAFVVTTGSSFLLSGAGNVVYDLYTRFARHEVEDRRRLLVHRLAVVAIAVLAYVLGQFFPSVLALQVYAYTVYGVAIAPAVFAVLFWPRATSAGALASMVLATLTTIGWEVAGLSQQVNAVIVSLPVSVAALVVVSLLTGRRRTPVEVAG
ncbi:sodium:solute symporter family protein [Pseudokineococcus sp. 1T1Z-3]|uniref:sodium:solute symporter family protein n=1 Tax=Pseudokineococcus sp. 1T1Z-3 TaxID=3132745 RepID=UPI0030990E28